MTKTKQITKAQVKREIKRLVRENPDRVNPVSRWGSCLYHEGRGRNIQRCIVGQMGFDLGLRTPLADYGGVWELAQVGVWKGLFTDSAVNYMGDVQAEADFDPVNYGPRPWGQIPKNVLNA